MAFEVGGKASHGRRPSMNVTPLVDVVLVLLIIFMVVTPLLTKKFWVHVPIKEEPQEPQAPLPPEQQPVVLMLGKDGTLRINREEVKREELPRRLARIFAARGDRTLFFDAEEGAAFGPAVEAMDLARGAGAFTIAVITKSTHP
jgi:biopolymer transport protein ExbD